MDVCDSLLLRESINEMTRSHPLLYVLSENEQVIQKVNDKFNQID